MKRAPELSAEDKQERVFRIFETIAKGYDSANVRISLGMQTGWKNMLIHEIARSGNEIVDRMHRKRDRAAIAGRRIAPRRLRILDLCTGTGDIAIGAAELLPGAKVTGMDFSPSMLKVAARKAKRSGQKAIRLRRGNAMKIPYRDGYFDIVSISFGLRNCADPEQVLREIFRVLRPGGMMFCLESFVPDLVPVRPLYRLYFAHVMPRIGGGRAHREEYEWLQESTERFMRAGELADRMRACGFEDVRMRRQMMGACVLHSGSKRHIQ